MKILLYSWRIYSMYDLKKCSKFVIFLVCFNRMILQRRKTYSKKRVFQQ